MEFREHWKNRKLIKDNVNFYIEVGPKNILTKLNKKIIPELKSEYIEAKKEYSND